VLRWLTLSLGAYIAVFLAIHVDWGEVVRNTIVPHLRSDRAFLAALIAIFGTTIMVGITMGFVGINPIRSLYWAAILSGVVAPPLILLMLILSNSHPAVGKMTGGRISDSLVAVAFLVMTALPILYLVS
jgi:Mn2+/Fe2+ NRAMP family transporter